MEIIRMRSADNIVRPKMTEVRYTDYKHTGVRMRLATIVLGIPPDETILDDYNSGRRKVMDAVVSYFRDYHIPNTVSDDIFLPDNYNPAAAALAIDCIRRGELKHSDVESFIKSHHGVLIIDMDSVYVNYKANSWLTKIWYEYCGEADCNCYFL
ncbi:MAG: hypothetical protein LUD18_07185 [Lachnospiraceae bacterium]|nr:hypothetical protein [Lachnospiraceae bacterium]